MDSKDGQYTYQMQEVSLRVEAINRVLSSRKPTLIRTELDNEFLWLQLRMIIEIVTFGGITADEERYAALRSEVLQNPDYTRDGKVRRILEALARITPHFLPIPLPDTATKDAAGVLHFERGPLVPTLEQFVEIHERAGEHLHTDNPFSPTKRAGTIERLRNSRETFLEDFGYVWAVLRRHAKVRLEFDPAVDKPTEPANATRVWIVQFDVPRKGHVQTLIGHWTENEPTDQ